MQRRRLFRTKGPQLTHCGKGLKVNNLLILNHHHPVIMIILIITIIIIILIITMINIIITIIMPRAFCVVDAPDEHFLADAS